MKTLPQLRSLLFWFLILQFCLISVSIAAASLLLVLSILTLLAIILLERKWTKYSTPLNYAFLAYSIIEIITALFAVDTAEALKNSKRLFLITIVYAVLISFSSKRKIVLSLQLLIGTAALLSILEIFLFFYEREERLTIFQHYMTTGGLKMIICLVTVPLILSTETNRLSKIFYGFSFLAIFFALLLTNTRSSWLGFIAGGIVISALQYRKLFFVLLAIIISFFIFAPEYQLDRARSIVDPTHPNNVGRLHMWETGLKMWQDKPFLGFGDIDLYKSYSQYRIPTEAEPAGHLHNIFLQLLVTTGLLGLCTVLFLFFKILKTEYTILKNSTSRLFKDISVAGIAVFTGFLVNGMFEWNFGDHEIMVFIWFTVGLCLAMNNIETTDIV